MFIHVVITYNYKCHDGVFYPVLTESIDGVRYFVAPKTRKGWEAMLWPVADAAFNPEK